MTAQLLGNWGTRTMSEPVAPEVEWHTAQDALGKTYYWNSKGDITYDSPRGTLSPVSAWVDSDVTFFDGVEAVEAYGKVKFGSSNSSRCSRCRSRAAAGPGAIEIPGSVAGAASSADSATAPGVDGTMASSFRHSREQSKATHTTRARERKGKLANGQLS